ncbi:hypothetical protein LAZ67_21002632 [Cordylochernes scorpioides]|uniref:Uncharacterized protein n=1 Tax=Cordylochernes scorpioides TaxID=51811 RepID=A0ABY6LRQ8_9ARAC|nr:hypothetical protein LAZ67_21002632 [Cordylochernes scorpioides]
MPQPPYSSHLAPCDFLLFPKLKRPMKGRRYATLDEIKTALKEEAEKYLKILFFERLRKLEKPLAHARILTRLAAPVWRREPAETGSRQFVLVSAASGGLTPRLAVCGVLPYVPALVINKTSTKGAPTTQSELMTKQRAQHNMVAAPGS